MDTKRTYTLEITGWNPEGEDVEDLVTVEAGSEEFAFALALDVARARVGLVEVGEVRTVA